LGIEAGAAEEKEHKKERLLGLSVPKEIAFGVGNTLMETRIL